MEYLSSHVFGFFIFLMKKIIWRSRPSNLESNGIPDVEFIFQQYKKLYDLPIESFEAKVSKKLYEYILRRDKFIVLLLYDNDAKCTGGKIGVRQFC